MAEGMRHRCEEGPISGGIFYGPVRRPLSADDEFFDDGNVQRALLTKMSVFAMLESNVRDHDLTDERETETLHGADLVAYGCPFHECNATFMSLRKQEAHYETCHRNHCATCGRSFPTYRLLDLHISEAHDSFFKASTERKAMYLCLVEGCPETFWSSGKRHRHLVGVHRYPENYDFSRASYTRRQAGTSDAMGSITMDAHSAEDPRSAEDAGDKRRPHRRRREVGAEARADRSSGSANSEDAAGTAAARNRDGLAASNVGMQERYAPASAPLIEETGMAVEIDTERLISSAGTLHAGEEDTITADARAGGMPMQRTLGRSENDDATEKIDAMEDSDVNELIGGMQKLLIPRHLSFGRSSRRGRGRRGSR